MIAGFIVAALVVGSLVYVLWTLRAGGEVQRLDIEEQDGTTLTTVVVRSAKTEIGEPDVPVSTPQLRAAGRHEIAMASHRAVIRRRLGLVVSLLVSAGIVAAYYVFPVVAVWWLVAVPCVMGAWVGLTRLSVVVVGRRLSHLLADLERGNDEPTKLLVLRQPAPEAAEEAPEAKPAAANPKQEMSVDMERPLPKPTVPSEPLPVNVPTYVNQPTLPRSLRHVDLGGLKGQGKVPIDATPPQDELPLFFGEARKPDDGPSEQLPKAVGE